MPRATSRTAVLSHRRLPTRWLQLAVVAWLALVLAGREHALQAFGVHLACIHPGAPVAQHAAEGDGEHHGGRSGDPEAAAHGSDGTEAPQAGAADLDTGDECPADCTECACGAAPFAAAVAFTFATRTWHDDGSPLLDRSRDGPSRPATTLERPPRRA